MVGNFVKTSKFRKMFSNEKLRIKTFSEIVRHKWHFVSENRNHSKVKVIGDTHINQGDETS